MLRSNRSRRNPAPTQPSLLHANQPAASPAPAADAGDPMVLDARLGPRPSREECIRKGLCFYCKKPGHDKNTCEEKRKNDSKFGRLTRYPPQVGRGTLMPANRGAPRAQAYMPRPQYPAPRPQFLPQPAFPQPDYPYNYLRATYDGFEREATSVNSSTPLPSAFTPSPSITPSIGAPGDERSENGPPLT